MPDKTVSTQSFASAAATSHIGKRLRVAIVGCGGISETHIKILKDMPEVELVAAVDLKPERLDIMQERYGFSAVFTDWKQMLKKEQPDAVNVCTPNGVHAARHNRRRKRRLPRPCRKAHGHDPRPVPQNDRRRQKKSHKTLRRFPIPLPPRHRLPSPRPRRQIVSATSCSSNARPSAAAESPTGASLARKHLQGGGPMIDIGVHVIEMAHWLMGSPKPVAASGNTWTYLGNKKSQVASHMAQLGP